MKWQTNFPVYLSLQPQEDAVMEVDEVVAFSAENIENIDSEDQMDPQLVSEYVNDIYEYMRMLEKEQSVKKNYLEQTKVTGT